MPGADSRERGRGLMIIAYRALAEGCPAGHARLARAEGEGIVADALWIDLVNPTPEDDRAVEAHLGVAIPTREEVRDLEPSEIIYSEGDASYMTARVLCNADGNVPKLTDVTFILTTRALVTVRYEEPRSFAMFVNRAAKPGPELASSSGVLDGLIATIVDRSVEVLRGVRYRMEVNARQVFEGRAQAVEQRGSYQRIIRSIGQYAHTISNVRESLSSIERVLLFLSASHGKERKEAKRIAAEWREALRDVRAIEEHAAFLANKLQFNLDATLGLVSLEQNKIIKLFSVVSVVLMPPTLIASLYGMNFKNMPELEWSFGYPMAILLMILAAVVPYQFFRWKRWF